MVRNKLIRLRKELEIELKGNILSFWIDHTVDRENGGFYGYVSNDLAKHDKSDKAFILNIRILWTFSKAFHIFKDQQYLEMAKRAYDYILNHFWDKEFGGVYWLLDYKGEVKVSKKQTYAQAFAIYGLTEYYRATGIQESLIKAKQLYELMEQHCYDPQYGGYTEAYSADWKALDDRSLSEKDMNVAKSMNTNLHVMEAYTNLLSVWNNDILKSKLRDLVNDTMEHIVDRQTYHFRLYFDEDWTSKSDIISFGHDIEGSWLLYEAAEQLCDALFCKKVKDIALMMAQKVYQQGIDFKQGGVFNEVDHNNILHAEKVWWPQAEAVVGFFNAYQLSSEVRYLQVALDTWDYIKNNIIDEKQGEWFWDARYANGQYQDEEKAGPWKCPYHNSRMCFEIIARINKMILVNPQFGS